MTAELWGSRLVRLMHELSDCKHLATRSVRQQTWCATCGAVRQARALRQLVLDGLRSPALRLVAAPLVDVAARKAFAGKGAR